jgi:cardiolipin-specific phospholipase
VTEAENFFVDSLESWRSQVGLEKMTLVGHSLGGYLSVAYALRYPERVSKLVLLSPAGVPRDPNATEVPSRELMESQQDAVNGPGKVGKVSQEGTHAERATKAGVEKVRKEQQVQKKEESRTRKFFTYLWEEGYSPFQVVRATSFYAPLLVGKYSSRRFSGLTEEETRDMHNYIQQITLAKGSGEYCISHILAPGAHARRPLVDRVAALKIPVTFVYGDHDWMDPKGGEDAVENMRKAGNGFGKMYIVPAAGHHVYLDNSRAVDELLVKELDRTAERRT